MPESKITLEDNNQGSVREFFNNWISDIHMSTTPEELARLTELATDSIKSPGHVQDLDIASMYAWAPLIIKQSLINKLFKQVRCGKSHRAKINAKRRLRLYKNAWIEYDTLEHMERTKKKISKSEMLKGPIAECKISFDYGAYNGDRNSAE